MQYMFDGATAYNQDLMWESVDVTKASTIVDAESFLTNKPSSYEKVSDNFVLLRVGQKI
jgi:hypothetical protein